MYSKTSRFACIMLSFLLLCSLLSVVNATIIYVNHSGYWSDTMPFTPSEAPLDEAWNKASLGDVIVIYADANNTKIMGTVVKSLDVRGGMLAILAILASFFIVLIMGYIANRKLDAGEMRRAVAGAFIVGFHILLVISLVTGFKTEMIISAYIAAVTAIIGFYFGSRTAQTGR
ncbi:MAG: hypothetical protein ACXQTS_01950 [Candidatus Methanospirareceae archaeon]